MPAAALTVVRDPVPEPPASVSRSRRALREPLAVASRFVRTAVARESVGDSWPLVAASLKEGFTREQWAAGDIPVVPYPVDNARWELVYSYQDSVGLRVALFPPAGSSTRPAVFDVELVSARGGPRKNWLVSGFTPAVQHGLLSPGPGRPAPAHSTEPLLGAAWLLLPLGVLGLALLVPLGLGIASLWREKRAERDFEER